MAAARQWHKSTSKFGILELSMSVLQTLSLQAMVKHELGGQAVNTP